MATPDELKVIIEKLAAGTATDEEIEVVRQACEGSDKITVQVAKYINNVNQAQGSQFGDRFAIGHRISELLYNPRRQPIKRI